MKKKQLLADKLAAGTAVASVSAAWWPAHTCSVSLYVKAMYDMKGRGPLGADAVRVAKGWDRHVEDDHELMIQHTSFELALVEAARRADSVAIDQAQASLTQNLIEQMTWYSSRLSAFPQRTFEVLMREHISLFLEAVLHKMDGNNRKVSLWERKRGHNAVLLGALMTEWI